MRQVLYYYTQTLYNKKRQREKTSRLRLLFFLYSWNSQMETKLNAVCVLYGYFFCSVCLFFRLLRLHTFRCHFVQDRFKHTLSRLLKAIVVYLCLVTYSSAFNVFPFFLVSTFGLFSHACSLRAFWQWNNKTFEKSLTWNSATLFSRFFRFENVLKYSLAATALLIHIFFVWFFFCVWFTRNVAALSKSEMTGIKNKTDTIQPFRAKRVCVCLLLFFY